MTRVWLFIIVALFIQEPATTDAAIFQVRHLVLNLWLINAIWILATVIDIMAGYWIGKWAQKRFKDTRIVRFAERWAARIEEFIGRSGEKFALILIGIVNFPYLNAFLFSWLKLSFRNIFILIFIGDAIYWAIEWGINIGVRSVFTDSHTALYIVVVLGLFFSIASKTILNQVLRRQS
jgi:membrane protein YqaA with SNARE-associated domain